MAAVVTPQLVIASTEAAIQLGQFISSSIKLYQEKAASQEQLQNAWTHMGLDFNYALSFYEGNPSVPPAPVASGTAVASGAASS